MPDYEVSPAEYIEIGRQKAQKEFEQKNYLDLLELARQDLKRAIGNEDRPSVKAFLELGEERIFNLWHALFYYKA